MSRLVNDDRDIQIFLEKPRRLLIIKTLFPVVDDEISELLIKRKSR